MPGSAYFPGQQGKRQARFAQNGHADMESGFSQHLVRRRPVMTRREMMHGHFAAFRMYVFRCAAQTRFVEGEGAVGARFARHAVRYTPAGRGSAQFGPGPLCPVKVSPEILSPGALWPVDPALCSSRPDRIDTTAYDAVPRQDPAPQPPDGGHEMPRNGSGCRRTVLQLQAPRASTSTLPCRCMLAWSPRRPRG